jgi:hypothetical protein
MGGLIGVLRSDNGDDRDEYSQGMLYAAKMINRFQESDPALLFRAAQDVDIRATTPWERGLARGLRLLAVEASESAYVPPLITDLER